MRDNLDKSSRRGAELVVDTLINEGVKHVFAIPGAKIDAVFDALVDRGPELIVVRHEQNAAFMAQAVGRLVQVLVTLPLDLLLQTLKGILLLL